MLYKNPSNGERTFLLVKPDAMHRSLLGEIIRRFEKRGFKLIACKFAAAGEEALKVANGVKLDEPVVLMVWQGLKISKEIITLSVALNGISGLNRGKKDISLAASDFQCE